jgi:phosphoribosylaminoimidazolecarboxamide formyltransferase/IMP cyclohydrolase
MSINVVDRIDDRIPLRRVLVSVSDKGGLETFIPQLLEVNPGVKLLSTGGTFGRIREILGPRADGALTQVSDYTGQPETQGGLVKTLDFKIYLGLLTETYNDAHQADLKRTGSAAIDMVVVNLYPFQRTVAAAGVTVEEARGNIDIGGPCMIRASANDGCTTLALRYDLARKAFAHTAAYDRAIADYLADKGIGDVAPLYRAG